MQTYQQITHPLRTSVWYGRRATRAHEQVFQTRHGLGCKPPCENRGAQHSLNVGWHEPIGGVPPARKANLVSVVYHGDSGHGHLEENDLLQGDGVSLEHPEGARRVVTGSNINTPPSWKQGTFGYYQSNACLSNHSSRYRFVSKILDSQRREQLQVQRRPLASKLRWSWWDARRRAT